MWVNQSRQTHKLTKLRPHKHLLLQTDPPHFTAKSCKTKWSFVENRNICQIWFFISFITSHQMHVFAKTILKQSEALPKIEIFVRYVKSYLLSRLIKCIFFIETIFNYDHVSLVCLQRAPNVCFKSFKCWLIKVDVWIWFKVYVEIRML